jgi:hypothetical protein
MADTLTPEQRAEAVVRKFGYVQSLERIHASTALVAAAIRAAETAAVGAERERCAKFADDFAARYRTQMHGEYRAGRHAEAERSLARCAAVEKVGAAIRTPTTEATHG